MMRCFSTGIGKCMSRMPNVRYIYIHICINSAMNDVCDHIILACITHH